MCLRLLDSARIGLAVPGRDNRSAMRKQHRAEWGNGVRGKCSARAIRAAIPLAKSLILSVLRVPSGRRSHRHGGAVAGPGGHQFPPLLKRVGASVSQFGRVADS